MRTIAHQLGSDQNASVCINQTSGSKGNIDVTIGIVKPPGVLIIGMHWKESSCLAKYLANQLYTSAIWTCRVTIIYAETEGHWYKTEPGFKSMV